jgi:hypothetical protein
MIIYILFLLSFVFLFKYLFTKKTVIIKEKFYEMTLEELNKYNGEDESKPIYIGLNGR